MVEVASLAGRGSSGVAKPFPVTTLLLDMHRVGLLTRPSSFFQQFEGVAGLILLPWLAWGVREGFREVLSEHNYAIQIDLILPQPLKETDDIVYRRLVVAAPAS